MTAAVTLGAMTGRELFSLLGETTVRGLAGRLGLTAALDRAAGLLARGGWWAIAVGRLFPGLRVQATEVAGILGVPRLTFLAGLLPAAAIYIGVFMGIGLLIGPAALHLIARVHPLLLTAAGLGAMFLFFAFHRVATPKRVGGRA